MYRDGTPSGGRPKGRQNDRTREIQRFCRSIVEDEQYRETVWERARNGTLGAMEAVIWGYGYGRPKDAIDISIRRLDEEAELASLSTEELQERMDAALRQLREAEEVKGLIEASIEVEPSALPVRTEDVDVEVR